MTGFGMPFRMEREMNFLRQTSEDNILYLSTNFSILSPPLNITTTSSLSIPTFFPIPFN
jgi:argininosuccinate lyase